MRRFYFSDQFCPPLPLAFMVVHFKLYDIKLQENGYRKITGSYFYHKSYKVDQIDDVKFYKKYVITDLINVYYSSRYLLFKSLLAFDFIYLCYFLVNILYCGENSLKGTCTQVHLVLPTD